VHPFLSVPLFVKNALKQGVFAYHCKIDTVFASSEREFISTTSELLPITTYNHCVAFAQLMHDQAEAID
jgi:hypothetical protein